MSIFPANCEGLFPPGSWSSTTLLLSTHFKRTHGIEQGNGSSLFSSQVCALRERHRPYAYHFVGFMHNGSRVADVSLSTHPPSNGTFKVVSSNFLFIKYI